MGGGGRGRSGWGGCQDGCDRRIELFVKIQKKNWGGSGLGGGGQDGFERRIEVFVKIKKKKNIYIFFFFFWGGGPGGGGWVGGSGWM